MRRSKSLRKSSTIRTSDHTNPLSCLVKCMKEKTSLLVVFVITVIFAVLFSGMLGYTQATVERWERMERAWSTTEGVVTSWAIRSSVSKYSGRTWSPYWSYSYTVNGQQFDSMSIAMPSAYNAHWYTSSAAAEADARARPIGSVVRVYYDPERPQRSVLDRRTASFGDWVMWGICVFIPGMVAWISLVLFRAMRNSRAELRSRQP
ncbi:DUF3592 domain-containing protein [Paraburkholderia sp. J76]|uniref:DUF3592 domain-containing protein n=1 Tax=Paraburkholderia sp. J76 TaxID=2805439 RepID=UPI0039F51C4B